MKRLNCIRVILCVGVVLMAGGNTKAAASDNDCPLPQCSTDRHPVCHKECDPNQPPLCVPVCICECVPNNASSSGSNQAAPAVESSSHAQTKQSNCWAKSDLFLRDSLRH
jgi:hypothetical protein